jgi:NAD(P)-dependent dehydrogenase (short-subunit alcohol dehydrogenase family)
MTLNGKRALVNGGSRGIGRAIVEALAAAGAHVVLSYDSHAADAAEVVRQVRARGAAAHAVKADTTSETDMAALVDHAQATLGGIDIYVHNAGGLCLPDFLDTAPDEWRRTIDVNLTGAFLGCQAVARRMVADSVAGAMVVISSGGAFGAQRGRVAYKVAKAGVEMLTRHMALELAPHGIRVNSVAPGMTLTDMTRDEIADPGRLAKRLDTIPMRIIGEPQDIAQGVLYLVSDQARLVSGTCLRIDGGRAAMNR